MLTAAPTKSGKLQEIVFKLLQEHDRDGAIPTNARFLYYELVQRGVLEKHKPQGEKGRRSDQNLHDALTKLRESERIPWDWIIDETRSLHDYTGWSSLADWATTSVQYVRLDPWRGRAPLVLCCAKAARLLECYAIWRKSMRSRYHQQTDRSASSCTPMSLRH